jgi:hypothetical protein
MTEVIPELDESETDRQEIYPGQQQENSSVSNYRDLSASISMHNSSFQGVDEEMTPCQRQMRTYLPTDLYTDAAFPSPASDSANMGYSIPTQSQTSFMSYIYQLLHLCQHLYNLPWIAHSRVVKDYVSGEEWKARKVSLHRTTSDQRKGWCLDIASDSAFDLTHPMDGLLKSPSHRRWQSAGQSKTQFPAAGTPRHSQLRRN